MTVWLDQNWKWLFAVLNVIFMAVVWALTKTFAKKDEHDKLAQRLVLIEKTVEDLPTHNQMHELELAMAELRGEIQSIKPSLLSVKNISDLLLENELKSSNDKS